MTPERVGQLVEDYKKTSLYLALHAQVSARIATANSADAKDPYEVMKLRGQVEAYQAILSHGFLNACAMQALAAEASIAPANPPMHPDDWREPLLREMGALDGDLVN